jgi:hypothetical protein
MIVDMSSVSIYRTHLAAFETNYIKIQESLRFSLKMFFLTKKTKFCEGKTNNLERIEYFAIFYYVP